MLGWVRSVYMWIHHTQASDAHDCLGCPCAPTVQCITSQRAQHLTCFDWRRLRQQQRRMPAPPQCAACSAASPPSQPPASWRPGCLQQPRPQQPPHLALHLQPLRSPPCWFWAADPQTAILLSLQNSRPARQTPHLPPQSSSQIAVHSPTLPLPPAQTPARGQAALQAPLTHHPAGSSISRGSRGRSRPCWQPCTGRGA